MSYSTLQEAADWLTWRLGGIDALGSPVTPKQVLRCGIHGQLPICAPLDVRCYSPSTKARNELAARTKNPTAWFLDNDVSGEKALAAATVDAVGLFMVPLRTLFKFEIADEVRLDLVTSPDGTETYCPGERVSVSRLVVPAGPLRKFADHIQASLREVKKPEKVALQLTEKNRPALRDALGMNEEEPTKKEHVWKPIKPQRDNGILGVLYESLADIHASGQPLPTARDVLALWRSKKPRRPVFEVLSSSVKFEKNNGDVEEVSIKGLSERIKRMTQ